MAYCKENYHWDLGIDKVRSTELKLLQFFLCAKWKLAIFSAFNNYRLLASRLPQIPLSKLPLQTSLKFFLKTKKTLFPSCSSIERLLTALIGIKDWLTTFVCNSATKRVPLPYTRMKARTIPTKTRLDARVIRGAIIESGPTALCSSILFFLP